MSMLLPLARKHKLTLAGPSLVDPNSWLPTNSYATLGNVAPLMDVNNLHNYLGPRNPETSGWGGLDAQGHSYGSMPWALDQAQIDGPGVPSWTTETGYQTDPNKAPNSISDADYAMYLPRLLFAQWNAGIQRTYIYELADEPSTPGSMGLLDKLGNRRPQYVALQNLLTQLADAGAFAPKALDFTITNDDGTLRHTLLQKHDGTLWLALWCGTSTPHTETVTISWAGYKNGYRVITFDATGASADHGHAAGTSATLAVSSFVTLLKIAP
jgi:hypothetical protein